MTKDGWFIIQKKYHNKAILPLYKFSVSVCVIAEGKAQKKIITNKLKSGMCAWCFWQQKGSTLS